MASQFLRTYPSWSGICDAGGMKHDILHSSEGRPPAACRNAGPHLLREQTAVAILMTGASYAEAMKATGLTFEQTVAAWNTRSTRPDADN